MTSHAAVTTGTWPRSRIHLRHRSHLPRPEGASSRRDETRTASSLEHFPGTALLRGLPACWRRRGAADPLGRLTW